MNNHKINHKINKYTNKLKSNKNITKGEIYQQKLRFYHRMNQLGGMNTELIGDPSIDENVKLDSLKNQLKTKQNEMKVILRQINELTGNKAKIIEKNLNDITKEVNQISKIYKNNIEQANALNKYKTNLDSEIKLTLDELKNESNNNNVSMNKTFQNLVTQSPNDISQLPIMFKFDMDTYQKIVELNQIADNVNKYIREQNKSQGDTQASEFYKKYIKYNFSDDQIKDNPTEFTKFYQTFENINGVLDDTKNHSQKDQIQKIIQKIKINLAK